jgi:DUF971 family protein
VWNVFLFSNKLVLLISCGYDCAVGENEVTGCMVKLAIENIASISGEVAIAWQDGTETYIKLEDLRRACPCATCQGEPDAMGRVVKPPVDYKAQSFDLVKMEVVGGYAVSFSWADGHSTGIYSYKYLRSFS